VLAAVDLDHEALFPTNEVADIGAYRFLPGKFKTADLPVAYAMPELGLGIGLVSAKFSRDLSATNTTSHRPSPVFAARSHPLPARAG
jgi:hypothetical protein